MSASASRYVVARIRPGRTFGVYDRRFREFCGFPRQPGGPGWYIERGTVEGAREWLNQCYALWDSGEIRAPENWRPLEGPYATARERTQPKP
ncbi:hypothetical protein SAMN05216251_10395 [Actinacidiphila alni]|uniref:Uncharacterized protein n=1 Tax=Actinacidiphila alni TaxID=380248 RepID=A0A1I2AHU6_9ACTN|nr:hypothetical protein SAMN05216251_10395 [Actinacidiphila alni]